jgi:hypothetical protein
MEAKNGRLVIKRAGTCRAGWGEAFRRLASAHDDRLQEWDGLPGTKWETGEWKW